jgi:hypothetical protein
MEAEAALGLQDRCEPADELTPSRWLGTTKPANGSQGLAVALPAMRRLAEAIASGIGIRGKKGPGHGSPARRCTIGYRRSRRA